MPFDGKISIEEVTIIRGPRWYDPMMLLEAAIGILILAVGTYAALVVTP